MGGDPSAYTALGLEPDADAAAVDPVYKRLIKEHHPDREGGSATRAAELNRAYRDLRGPGAKTRSNSTIIPTNIGASRDGRSRLRRSALG